MHTPEIQHTANTDALPDSTCPPDASKRDRMTPNADPWQQKTREGKIQAGLLLPCVLTSINARLTASGFCSGPISVVAGQAFLLPGFILAQASRVQHAHKHRLLCIPRSARFYANEAYFWRLLLVSTFPPTMGIYTKLNAGRWGYSPLLNRISFARKKSEWTSPKFVAVWRAARCERNRKYILPPNLTWPCSTFDVFMINLAQCWHYCKTRT